MSRAHLIRALLLAFVALASVPGLAAAADLMPAHKAPLVAESHPWYLEFEAGAGAFDPSNPNPGIVYGCPPTNCDGGSYTETLDWSGGPVVGARFGYQFSKLFRADLSIDWMSTTTVGNINWIGNPQCSSEGGCSLNATKTASALVGLVNGYAELDPLLGVNRGHWHPYLTAGVGAAGDHLSSNCVDCNYLSAGTAKTTMEFAWDAGLGAQIDVFSDLRLDIAYRFYDLGKFRGGNNGFSGQYLTGNDSFTMLVNTFTAGLIYPF